VTAARFLVVAAALAIGAPARAQDPLQLERPLSRLWPVTFDAHVLIGVEPQGSRGNPIAFGVGAEVLWRARIGGFAALLSSAGTPLHPNVIGTTTEPSLADRISVPLALAWRPFTPIAEHGNGFFHRLLAGIGLQAGLTIEHVRTSDDSDTTAGLHLGASVDVPLFGSALQGGLSLRLYGRVMVTGSSSLDVKLTQPVYEKGVNGQFFGGLCYYP